MPERGILVGRSAPFLRMLQLIKKVSAFDAPVLIEGETGTGKELAARAIHYGGPRADQPFVPVNCGAVPENLVESEFFGHRRGAFTDARTDRPGVVQLADKGTLFLDEVESLSPKAQVVLLRFLQDQHYRPIGGTKELRADVRIVAATHEDLESAVQAGGFRRDLFYRLRLLQVQLPPLRTRSGDPRVLAEYFLEACTRRNRLPAMVIHPDTLAWFEQYGWPGNVRELENLVMREALLSDGPELRIEPPVLQRQATIASAPEEPVERALQAPDPYAAARARALAAFDRAYLEGVLARAGGNVTRAARLAGKERRSLGRLLKKYHLDPGQYRVWLSPKAG